MSSELSAGVFIDGGYVSNLLKQHFNEAQIDYGKFASWAAKDALLYRTYYYDCLPYHGREPTEDEALRLGRKQAFFNALNRLNRFTVRQGVLVYRGHDAEGNPILVQKRVDLQLGLDISLLVSKGFINLVVIVTGDSDMIPAVLAAKEQGVLVRLVHGPRQTYNQELWDVVDERYEITEPVVRSMILER
jgi:uncharacterized LabA/DUF88 family protein